VLLILAVALAAMGFPASSSPTQASSPACFVSQADTTYRVVPKDRVVRVSVDHTTYNRCSRYILVGVEFGSIPTSARKVRFAGSGIRAAPDRPEGKWRTYDVVHPRVLPGRSVRFRVSYELPTGRTTWNQFIVRDDYMHLCWVGHGADSGTTKAIFPRKSKPLTYVGSTKTKKAGGGVVVSAKRTRQPGQLWFCADVYDAERMTSARIESQSGGTVRIQGFADDNGWSDRIKASVQYALPRLEELFGTPVRPGRVITIREVPQRSLGAYAGTHYRTGYIRLADDDQHVVAHELAHEWSDGRNYVGEWLQEGIADWTANEASMAGQAQSCSHPGDYPGKGKPRLLKWLRLPAKYTERQEDLVDYQYEAACYIVTHLAALMGHERMRDVIQTTLDGDPPYGGSPRSKSAKRRPAGWREFLDAVDELGLVPSGRTGLVRAEEMFLEFGIATRKDLAGRNRARERYHMLLGGHAEVTAPRVVRDLMDGWEFKQAHRAMAIAEDIAPRLRGALSRIERSPDAGATPGGPEAGVATEGEGDPDVELLPEEAAALSKLVRRYESAGSIKALRKLRHDVRDLPMPVEIDEEAAATPAPQATAPPAHRDTRS
jgi:hypothetical protein